MSLRDWLLRLEGKLDRVLNGPAPAESPTVDVESAMLITGDKSKPSFYRTVVSLGVRPFKRGHYRRVELVNAMGRRSMELARRAKHDAHGERATEAQRKLTSPNPHCD